MPAPARRTSPEAATVALVAVTGAARLAAAWGAGLSWDESYHFACALHPSLSYFDHPPLTFLVGGLSLALSGAPGSLVLRWPFVVLFAGTTWLMFVLGRRLFGPWAGFYAALLLNVAPVFSLAIGTFFKPDGPLMFFWLACVWCLAHVLVGPAARRPLVWWAAAGAMLGLGMLSKYTMVLLVAGAGLWVLWRRDQRRWLAHPGPYLALGIAAALFSPVLVWNAQHGWVSFAFQGARGVDEWSGIHLDWMLRNVGGQAFQLFPWVWAALVVEAVRSFGPRPPQPARRFIACLALVPIVLFTLAASYVAITRHLFHWGMPGYLLLFLPLGDTVARRLAARSAAWRWSLAVTVAVAALVMTVVATDVATGWVDEVPGVSAALARFGEDDPTLEYIDFTGLEPALAARGLLGRRDVFVFSDFWHRAGKVSYALGGRVPVLAFNARDPRGFAFFDGGSARWLGRDGILVTEKRRVLQVESYFGRYFDRITPLGEVDVGRRGRSELQLYLYLCERLKIPFPRPYGPGL